MHHSVMPLLPSKEGGDDRREGTRNTTSGEKKKFFMTAILSRRVNAFRFIRPSSGLYFLHV